MKYMNASRRLAVMKMKKDPDTDDAKTVKRAASAWIENTVKSSDAKGQTKNADKNVEVHKKYTSRV